MPPLLSLETRQAVLQTLVAVVYSLALPRPALPRSSLPSPPSFLLLLVSTNVPLLLLPPLLLPPLLLPLWLQLLLLLTLLRTLLPRCFTLLQPVGSCTSFTHTCQCTVCASLFSCP